MRRLAALCVYYLVVFAVGGVFLPYFPRWLEAQGMHGSRLGLISAAAPAMSVVAPIAIGVLADVFGVRGWLLQVAWGGALVTLLALTGFELLHVPLGFGALMLFALVLALFRSPTTFIADVLALEHTVGEKTSYGRLRLWGSLGFMAAVVAVPRIMDSTDALAFPLTMSVMTFGALLAALALPRRSALPARQVSRSSEPLWADRGVRYFLITAFVSQCGHSAYDLCFTIHLFALGISPTNVGTAWAIGTGAEVLMMAYGVPLFRAFSPASVLALGLVGASVRWILIAATKSPVALLCLQPLHAVSFGVVWLSMVGYTSRRFPSRSLATAQGALSTCLSGGAVVGMVLWGAVFQRFGGAVVFDGAALVSMIAALSALAVRHYSACWDANQDGNSDGFEPLPPSRDCGSHAL